MTSGTEQERVKEVIVESRIAKVLALRTDSIVMLEALDAISEFYTTNDVEARKNLRHHLELSNIEYGKKFLLEMGQLKNRLDSAEVLSNALKDSCATLSQRVQEADTNMKSFISKAGQLEESRSQLINMSKEIKEFLNKFHLSPEEVVLLAKAKLDVASQAKNFFMVLNKVKNAYADCKALAQNQGYSIGFELLEMLGRHADSAYGLLYAYVKDKCDYLCEAGSVEDVEMNSRLQLSIYHLQAAPSYHAQCADLLVGARRALLLRRFITTLGSTGSGGSSGVVGEMGAMLAIVHQGVVGEKEFLEAIYPNSAASPSDLLVRTVSVLSKPLKIRLQQALERASLVDLYALTDLQIFYLVTLSPLLGDGQASSNQLVTILMDSVVSCKQMFNTALTTQCKSVGSQGISYPVNLQVSNVAREYVHQVSSLLKAYNTSLSPAAPNTSAADGPTSPLVIDSILGDVITSLLQGVRLGATNLSEVDMAVYMLNTLQAVQVEVKAVQVGAGKQQTLWEGLLDSEASSWTTILVTAETTRFLHRSDLDSLLLLCDLPKGLVACEQLGLSPDRVATVLRAFYASLATVSELSSLAPTMREAVRYKVAQEVSGAYAKLHALVSDQTNGYDGSMLVHTVEEVKVLLGCH